MSSHTQCLSQCSFLIFPLQDKYYRTGEKRTILQVNISSIGRGCHISYLQPTTYKTSLTSPRYSTKISNTTNKASSAKIIQILEGYVISVARIKLIGVTSTQIPNEQNRRNKMKKQKKQVRPKNCRGLIFHKIGNGKRNGCP